MRAVHVDTRQQKGKHDRKHADMERAGAVLVRHGLDVGDYAQAPRCAVDTKRDLCELAACLKQGHRRFAGECDRAREQGTLLVILTENEYGIASLADLAAWEEPMAAFELRAKKSGGKVQERLSGANLAGICERMHADHGVLFGFCHPSEAGRRVLEILEKGERIGNEDIDTA